MSGIPDQRGPGRACLEEATRKQGELGADRAKSRTIVCVGVSQFEVSKKV